MSNPEFLAEGTAIADFTKPDRVVVGAYDEADGDVVARLYEPFGAPIVRMDVASAEMAKLASNAFLATKISFINEIANVCEETGADVASVAEAMGLDRRIGRLFLRAGIGYSGSCLPKDVTALKQLAGNSGYHFRLLTGRDRGQRAAEAPRRWQAPQAPRPAARQDDRPPRPGVQTGHERHAERTEPLARAAPARRGRPRARVGSVVGEEARELLRGVELVPTVSAAVAGADAAVIVTEWPELRELVSEENRAAMDNPLIVDGRNMLDPREVRAAGFAYEAIGRTSTVLEALPETAEPEPERELHG